MKFCCKREGEVTDWFAIAIICTTELFNMVDAGITYPLANSGKAVSRALMILS